MAGDELRVKVLVHMSGLSEETSFLPGREYVLPRTIAERFVEHGVAELVTEVSTAGDRTEIAADIAKPTRRPRASTRKEAADAQD